MDDKPAFWFPSKRCGWGWGFPMRWQGWVVSAAYLALVFGGILLIMGDRNEDRDAAWAFAYGLAVTVVFVVVVVIKGERPDRRRRGNE